MNRMLYLVFSNKSHIKLKKKVFDKKKYKKMKTTYINEIDDITYDFQYDNELSRYMDQFKQEK